MPKPAILRAAHLPEQPNAELDAAFEVHDLPDDTDAAAALLADTGQRLRGMALRKTRVDAALLDQLPALEIISSYSAGLENVDLKATQARGITVANTSHVLADEVANLALGQILAVTRDLHNADAFVRDGRWSGGAYPLQVSLKGMAVGLVGMGQIGQALAVRLQTAGAEVRYTGPRQKPVAWPYHVDALDLARQCRLVVMACPLTVQTRGLADRTFLRAIGPDGWFVNISRGAVHDEAALIEVLADGGLAGAALDVFADEPTVPEALRNDRRVLLTPHIGSGTVETRQGMGDALVDALVAQLDAVPPRR